MPRSLQRMSFPRPQGTRSGGAPSWAIPLAMSGGLLLASVPASADIYKSVGADGVISFTSRPKQGSKLYARGDRPEHTPWRSHSWKIRRGAGMRSSIEETMLRSRRGAGTWQYSGKPRSYCGHSPCTTK